MLLHRLGMEHRKPRAISRQLDPAKQAAFIKRYEALMNQLEADEAVMFADAVHPTVMGSPRVAADSREFIDLSELTSMKTFITSFAGQIAAEAAR